MFSSVVRSSIQILLKKSSNKYFNYFYQNTQLRSSFRSFSVTQTMTEFIIPNDQTFVSLDCNEAFNNLSTKEKLYVHYLSKAAWYGALIVPFQISLESPLIFILLRKLFREESIEDLKKKALSQCEFTEDEFTAFLIYSAGIFDNAGNYKHFGDLKFIPNLPKEKFFKLISVSKAATSDSQKVKWLIDNCAEKIFSLGDFEKQLGFPQVGTTTYLSKNMSESDSDTINEFFKKQNLMPYNTRAFKTTDETGTSCYEIRFASVLTSVDSEDYNILGSHTVNGHKFIFTRGDFSKLMELTNAYLLKAKEYASNEIESKMLDQYIHSFKTGSIDAHKNGSSLWITNKKPIIETYIGFIETYRDPARQRGEFEGFVAVVNKPMSVKFETLVNAADHLLTFLPWPSTYENKKMIKPDFTSLDIVTFGGSGVPAGINIPNYEDIRQNKGFKNVSLGNVISCHKRSPNHLSPEDKELFMKLQSKVFELQVGLHEFLGHGSGKLFKQDKDGFNFDDNVLDLETEKKITTWYKEGETFHSVFGSMHNAYEECRAETIALYLSTVPDIQKLFGYNDQIEELNYMSWLSMAYSGFASLWCYQPNSKSWLQAHSQARYVILSVLLEADDTFIQIKEVTGEDGKPDILFSLDKSKIMTIGRPAIGAFLKKMQLYKCTANIAKASAMFEKYSILSDDGKYPFLKYREIVVARRKQRIMLVQANTVIKNGEVNLQAYDSNVQGLIQSWIDRFPEHDRELDMICEELWKKDHLYFA